MAESSRRYNLRDTRKKPQGVLLKRWEVEYSKLISNENRRIPLETIKIAIQSAFEDGMFEQWRITLKCPLSGQRIKIPARYADCTHIECFDLEAFLRMKTQKNLLVCPVCQKEVEKPLTNLRIDKYIETVLSTLPDAMQVELLPDGSFTEVHAEFVSVPNVINDEEPYVQDSNMPSFNVKQEALEDDDDYITLSDGEDVDLEEITIVDMKPISLMPLNMDIKPKITSSEPEQIHSQEDQEIQDQHNDATQNADIDENDQKCSTGSAVIIQFNVKTEPEAEKTSETEILGTVEVRKRKAPSKFAGLTSQTSGAIAQQNVESEGESSNLRPMKHAKTDLGTSNTQRRIIDGIPLRKQYPLGSANADPEQIPGFNNSKDQEEQIATSTSTVANLTNKSATGLLQQTCIMSKTVPGQSVKRAGLPIAGSSGSESKKRSRERVEFLEDAWLEALKFITGQKWSKMRLVTRQLNDVVQRNVSRLPLAIIDSADIRLKERQKTEVELIVLDSTILPDKKDQWFKDQGMTIDVPASIQLNNAILGFELKTNSCADLCILGPAHEEELTPYEKYYPWFCERSLQFKSKVLFYAEFSPHRNKYSWASMAFFLKLLYDQSTYVKEISMYAFINKLKDILFTSEEKRYIRCGNFKLEMTDDVNVVDLCKSVSWLEKNVQADNIEFPSSIHYDDSDISDTVTNYFFGLSWISANQVVKLGRVNDLEHFFKALIKKFRTISTVQRIFPTILFSGSRRIRDDPLEKLLSGKGITKKKRGKSEDAEDDDNPEIYTISNGSNRMRIEFASEPEENIPKILCRLRFAYGYDIRVTVEANE